MELSPLLMGLGQDQTQQLCGCEAGKGDESMSAAMVTNRFTGLCSAFIGKTPVLQMVVTLPGSDVTRPCGSEHPLGIRSFAAPEKLKEK